MTAPDPRAVSDVYRTGRKVGRTVYRMVGPEPSDDDVLVGMMDTRELAAAVVEAMNAAASGRLLPEGGDTRQEWGARWTFKGRQVYETGGDRAHCQWVANCGAGGELVTRTVVDLPDGGARVGPWQPVDTEGEQQ